MTADDLKAILDPIQQQWLPSIECADAPEWRAHYVRAAISEAFIAGRQSMLQPLHEADYPAHAVADADSPTDPHRMADAVFAATAQPKASAAQ